MPLVRIRDTEMWVDDSGPSTTGETIVFSHGLLMSAEMFDAQVAALSGRYRCIRYDHRGQARSADSDMRSIDMGVTTADAVALIEHFGVAPVHFVGLSMGGFVGMRIAARRPELVRSLALLDTSADAEPAANIPKYVAMNAIARYLGARALVDQVMPIMFGRTFLSDATRAAERKRWREHIRATRRSIWRAVNGVLERETVAPELGRIRARTVVVVGEEDVATTPDKAERIHAAIVGSRLVRVARAGHSSTIEAPDAVTAAIVETLEAR